VIASVCVLCFIKSGSNQIKSNQLKSNLFVEFPSTVGSPITTGLRSRIFGCESNRRKTSTI
jgi:hypothetical protein